MGSKYKVYKHLILSETYYKYFQNISLSLLVIKIYIINYNEIFFIKNLTLIIGTILIVEPFFNNISMKEILERQQWFQI